MTIAIIGYFGWYGSMAELVADSFQKNGYEVIRYDRKQLPNIGKHLLYLFVDCSEDYSLSIPLLEGTKVFWSLDAQMPGGIERSVNIARKCDFVFSSNKEQGVNLLEKFGIKSFLLPITYGDCLIDVDTKERKTLDVVMIGNPNSQLRLLLWEKIRAKYKSFCGRAETKEEFINALSRAKIVVNQPTEPFDNILNNRFFEGMASNALVLQKRLSTTLIEDLGFKEGKHFIYWNNFDDLFSKIDYYLKNEGLRLKIAKEGNSFVRQYSISKQCKKMEYIMLLNSSYARTPIASI